MKPARFQGPRRRHRSFSSRHRECVLEPAWRRAHERARTPRNRRGIARHLDRKCGRRLVQAHAADRHPIVYNDKFYTMDPEATIRAISSANGATLWAVKTVPSQKTSFDYLHPFNSNNVSRDGFGGGLAANGGKIFAGRFRFGVRARCGSGQVIWTKNFEIPIREARPPQGPRFRRELRKRIWCLNAPTARSFGCRRAFPKTPLS